MSIVKDLLSLILCLSFLPSLWFFDNKLVAILMFCLLILNFKFYNCLKKRLIKEREYFVKTLSHDLRVSTLAQIRGLNILESSSNNIQEEKELISEINDSCKYTLDMITMLLNTYRFKNGEEVLKYERFNFAEVINSALTDLQILAMDKGVKIYRSNLPTLVIDADKYAIKKVLSTLISTAVFYSMQNGSILVNIKNTQKDFIIEIIYKGTPLSEEECRRMFNESPRFSTVGHGIKMHLCKRIVEFHGGKIYVNNIDNNLNSFTFTLPIDKKTKTAKPPLISRLETMAF